MEKEEKYALYRADMREWRRGIFLIGLPVMIQTLVNSLVNMADVFMAGQLGEVAITASALGNSWFFMYVLLLGGITAAGSIFIAQYWGAGQTGEIHKYMGIMFVGSGLFMLPLGLVSVFGSDFVIRLYSKDAEVIACGREYIRVIGYSYFLFPVTNVLAAALKSTENTRIPMIGTLLSLFLNLLLNYLLIFGRFGMPQMGVMGAAVATLIARIAELFFIAGYVFGRKSAVAANLGAYFSFGTKHVKEYFRYGFFVILGECIYAVGTSVYHIAYKYTGTEAQAALQIVNSLGNLAMVTAIGIGQSAGVVVGKQLGRNELDKARRFCNLYLLFSLLFSVMMAALVVLTEPFYVSFFRVGDTAKDYVLKMVWVLALTLPFKGVNFTVVTGILRSGGDSNYCFLANFTGTWLVGIPLAFLGAAVLRLPVYLVYLMIGADEVSKLMLCLPRALRGRWIRNLSLSEK